VGAGPSLSVDAVTEHVERGSQAAAGAGFGKWVVVADEDQLGAGAGHVVHDTARSRAAAMRASSIHDHRGRVDVTVLDEVASERRRADACAGLELAGGACRWRQADDGEPGVLAQRPDDAEGVGRARSRPSEEDRDPITRCGQGRHGGCVVVAQDRVPRDRCRTERIDESDLFGLMGPIVRRARRSSR